VLSAIETMHDVTSNPSMLDYNYPYVNFAHTELLNYWITTASGMQKLNCSLLANRKAEPAALVNGKTQPRRLESGPHTGSIRQCHSILI